MKSSDSINEISAALAKAQGEIKNPAKNATNPHFKNEYADLASGIDAIKAALSKNGIAVVQVTEAEGDAIILHTRLLHSSGQWIGGTYPVCRIGGKHQEMGSALTYARRYALFAIVSVAGDDDDDGNVAAAPAPRSVAADENPFDGDPDAAIAYTESCLGIIDTFQTEQEGRDWWNGQAAKRREVQVGQAQISIMLDRMKARFEALRADASQLEAAE